MAGSPRLRGGVRGVRVFSNRGRRGQELSPRARGDPPRGVRGAAGPFGRPRRRARRERRRRRRKREERDGNLAPFRALPRRWLARWRAFAFAKGAKRRARQARWAAPRRRGAPASRRSARRQKSSSAPRGLAAPGDLYRPRRSDENGVADDDDAAALDAEKTRARCAPSSGTGRHERTNEQRHTIKNERRRETTAISSPSPAVSSWNSSPRRRRRRWRRRWAGRVARRGASGRARGDLGVRAGGVRGVRERHRAFGTAEGLEGLPVGGAANTPLRIPGRLRAARPGFPGGVRARRRRPRRGDRRQTRAFSVGRKCRPRAGARGAPDAFGPRKRPRASRENQHTARARRRSRERGEAAGSAAARRRRGPPPARPRRPRVFARRGPRLHGMAREAAAAREARDPPAGHVAVLRDVQARRRERTRARRARVLRQRGPARGV